MKCVQDIKTNLIIRCSDDEAERLVKSGMCRYIQKQQFKAQEKAKLVKA